MGGGGNDDRNVGLRAGLTTRMVLLSGLLASVLFLHVRDGDHLRWFRVVYWLADRLG